MNRYSLKKYDGYVFSILLVVLITFLIPKINIVDIFGSGIRADDILLAILGLILFLLYLSGKIKVSVEFVKIFKLVLYITLVGIMSWTNSCLDSNCSMSGLFFSIRLLEYSLFLFVGYMLREKVDVIKFVLFIGFFNLFIVFLQKAGLLGGFPTGIYQADLSVRPIGLTSGPWEVATLLSFTAAYILHVRFFSLGITITLFLLLMFGVVLLDSRIGLVGLAVASVYSIMKGRPFKFRFFSFIIIVPILSLAVLYFISGSERGGKVLDAQNFAYIESAIDSVDINNYEMNEPLYKKYGEFDYQTGDASLAARALKWIYVFKVILNDGDSSLIGKGPGYFGVAVDGSYVRIFGELGVLGLFLYLLLLKKAYRLSPELSIFVLILIFNAIFIDILFASRSMSLFFLLIGFSLSGRYQFKNDKIF